MKRYLKPCKPVKASKRMLDRALRQQLAELRKAHALADKWCEEARRHGDMAARQRRRAEDAEAEVRRLRGILEGMTKPVMRHAHLQFRPGGFEDRVNTMMRWWEITGRLDVGVTLDFHQVRMLPQGDREAWVKGFLEAFLNRCREEAVKVLRIVG